jgi:hypothetical protein
MIESLIKVIELGSKYSWAFAVAIAFVLFVPESAAAQLGILPIRAQFLGPLWIGLVGSLALFTSGLGPILQSSIRGLLARRAEAQKIAEAKQERRVLMLNRLRSLSPEELMWFQYCLYYGQQTIFGEAHHPLAFALVSKKMLVMGGGDVWRVSYTLTDETWNLAKEITDELLPPEMREKNDFEQDLAVFARSIKPSII